MSSLQSPTPSPAPAPFAAARRALLPAFALPAWLASALLKRLAPPAASRPATAATTSRRPTETESDAPTAMQTLVAQFVLHATTTARTPTPGNTLQTPLHAARARPRVSGTAVAKSKQSSGGTASRSQPQTGSQAQARAQAQAQARTKAKTQSQTQTKAQAQAQTRTRTQPQPLQPLPSPPPPAGAQPPALYHSLYGSFGRARAPPAAAPLATDAADGQRILSGLRAMHAQRAAQERRSGPAWFGALLSVLVLVVSPFK